MEELPPYVIPMVVLARKASFHILEYLTTSQARFNLCLQPSNRRIPRMVSDHHIMLVLLILTKEKRMMTVQSCGSVCTPFSSTLIEVFEVEMIGVWG